MIKLYVEFFDDEGDHFDETSFVVSIKNDAEDIIEYFKDNNNVEISFDWVAGSQGVDEVKAAIEDMIREMKAELE